MDDLRAFAEQGLERRRGEVGRRRDHHRGRAGALRRTHVGPGRRAAGGDHARTCRRAPTRRAGALRRPTRGPRRTGSAKRWRRSPTASSRRCSTSPPCGSRTRRVRRGAIVSLRRCATCTTSTATEVALRIATRAARWPGGRPSTSPLRCRDREPGIAVERPGDHRPRIGASTCPSRRWGARGSSPRRSRRRSSTGAPTSPCTPPRTSLRPPCRAWCSRRCPSGATPATHCAGADSTTCPPDPRWPPGRPAVVPSSRRCGPMSVSPSCAGTWPSVSPAQMQARRHRGRGGRARSVGACGSTRRGVRRRDRRPTGRPGRAGRGVPCGRRRDHRSAGADPARPEPSSARSRTGVPRPTRRRLHDAGGCPRRHRGRRSSDRDGPARRDGWRSWAPLGLHRDG